jgi:hypothetical protein
MLGAAAVVFAVFGSVVAGAGTNAGYQSKRRGKRSHGPEFVQRSGGGARRTDRDIRQ